MKKINNLLHDLMPRSFQMLHEDDIDYKSEDHSFPSALPNGINFEDIQMAIALQTFKKNIHDTRFGKLPEDVLDLIFESCTPAWKYEKRNLY